MNRRVPSEAGRVRARGAPRPLTAWAHLAVLWSFAFAKPLFDILADSPEFFVARENTAGDIVLLALAVTLVPPTLLLAFELPLGRAPRARRLLHLSFVALLGGAIAIQVLKDVTSSPSALLIPVSLAAGAAGAVAYERGPVVRTTLTVLSPLPLLFVIAFLLFSPVSELVLPQETESAQAGSAGTERVPIVMVVFDELSGRSLMNAEGRIDPTRYPSFARLARDATWYRNATTVADNTPQAVPAILTGERPTRDQLPTRSDHPDNLFTFLGDRYDFNVHEPITDLCPPDLCPDAARGSAGDRLQDLLSDLTVVALHTLSPDELRAELPAVDQTFGGFGARGTAASAGLLPAWLRALKRRSETFERFVRAIGRKSRLPALDFIHTELPHIPWDYLPSGRQYLTGSDAVPGLTDDTWGPDDRLVTQGHQRYLLQLGYVDRLLGQLIDRLQSRGLYRRSLLIVTADHGVAFRPGAPRRTLSSPTFEDIAGVPLLVKAPRQRRGRIDDAPTTTVDIVPTIADYVGTQLPWRGDGRSLRTPRAETRTEISVFSKLASSLTVPLSDFRRRRGEALHSDTMTFGSNDHRKGVFAPGADSSLVGIPTAELSQDSPLHDRVVLDDPKLFSSIARGAQILPAFVKGRIVGGGAPQQLAVAINGRIGAVTQSYETGEGTRFEAIADPQTLAVGANEITVFALRGDGPAFRLAPLGQDAGATYRLGERGGREAIRSSSHRRVPVVPKVAGGVVETVEVRGATLRVSGWSASRQSTAQRVLVFIGGRFVASGEPTLSRPGVAKNLGEGARVSGFQIATQLGTGDRSRTRQALRVFGVIGRRAFELRSEDDE